MEPPHEKGFTLLHAMRRLQRLIMAQVVITGVVILVFLAVLVPGERLIRILDTASYSLLGGANIHFANLGNQGGQYLEDIQEETSLSRNPLMHMWYLGLEEQFYLCYPWMFVAAHCGRIPLCGSPCGAAGGSITSSKMWQMVLVFGGLSVVSFCINVHLEYTDPVTAFFMLHPRGWEVFRDGDGPIFILSKGFQKCFPAMACS